MTDTEAFLQLLRLENGNLESVREEEPFLDDAIVYLSTALAHDCMAWEDPEKYIDPNLELIESVARFGCLLKLYGHCLLCAVRIFNCACEIKTKKFQVAVVFALVRTLVSLYLH